MERNRRTLFFLNSLIMIQTALLGSILAFNFASQTREQTIASISDAVETKEIKIILTGDIMLDRGVELVSIKNKDWRWPVLRIVDYLDEADIVFGNLESPISDKGFKAGSIYSFRARPEAIQALAVFDVLSFANNHSFDYTRLAFEDTMGRLKEKGISYIGAGFNKKEAHSPAIKEIEGTRIAFLGCSQFGPESWKAGAGSGIFLVNENNLGEMQEAVRAAKKEADIVIVSVHAGEEYSEPNKFQEDFARAAVEAGADVVVGHHPHVVQPHVKMGDSWVFYSLGNFIFDQNFSQETMEGLAIELIIEDKKVVDVIPRKTVISESLQPSLYEERKSKIE